MPYHVVSDGARLFYRVQGKQDAKGPVLLFVHGWCSNLEHWAPQVKRFARSHRILRLDRRGMGRSTSPGSGHTAERHAADIAEVAKAAGVRRVIAIGHAGGGPSTLELTRSYPQLVKAAVLVDTGLHPLPQLDNPGNAFGAVLAPMIQALEGAGGGAAFKRMYQGFFSPKCNREVSGAAVRDAMRTPLPVAAAELRGMVVSTEQMARDITQPVLWLTASGVDQKYIGNQFKDVRFAQVVGSGHFPQLEVPEQTNAMIATFLEQLG